MMYPEHSSLQNNQHSLAKNYLHSSHIFDKIFDVIINIELWSEAEWEKIRKGIWKSLYPFLIYLTGIDEETRRSKKAVRNSHDAARKSIKRGSKIHMIRILKEYLIKIMKKQLNIEINEDIKVITKDIKDKFIYDEIRENMVAYVKNNKKHLVLMRKPLFVFCTELFDFISGDTFNHISMLKRRLGVTTNKRSALVDALAKMGIEVSERAIKRWEKGGSIQRKTLNDILEIFDNPLQRHFFYYYGGLKIGITAREFSKFLNTLWYGSYHPFHSIKLEDLNREEMVFYRYLRKDMIYPLASMTGKIKDSASQAAPGQTG